MSIVFYVSGHGFGHASRAIEVMRALLGSGTPRRIVVRTAVPRWFFDAVAGPAGAAPGSAVEIQAVETDTGVAQIDSLQIDERATAGHAAAFHQTFAARVAAEADVLATLRAQVVVGDVPPLAFAAARTAGVPAVLIANFTWDWIYGAFPDFEVHAPGVLAAIRGAYATAAVALRLPLHGPLAPVAGPVHDIPLIARRSALGRDETRRRLPLEAGMPVVLASFGRYGATLPYEVVARDNPFTVVITDHETRADGDRTVPRLCRLSSTDMQTLGLEYQDLVAAADVVVSKPGYGIVSECIANGTALLYTSRGRFPEYDVFVREMPHVLRCLPLAQQDLRAGRWSEAVDALLRQPDPPRRLPIDGADVAAQEILRMCRSEA